MRQHLPVFSVLLPVDPEGVFSVLPGRDGRAGGGVARDLFCGLYEQYWSSTPADAPPYLASPQIRECVVGVLAREREHGRLGLCLVFAFVMEIIQRVEWKQV